MIEKTAIERVENPDQQANYALLGTQWLILFCFVRRIEVKTEKAPANRSRGCLFQTNHYHYYTFGASKNPAQVLIHSFSPEYRRNALRLALRLALYLLKTTNDFDLP